MKNKTLLKVLLWFAKAFKILSIIASILVLISLIISLFNPDFKPNFNIGYFIFEPSTHISGEYMTNSGNSKFEVSTVILKSIAFHPEQKVLWLLAIGILISISVTVYILNKLIDVLRNLLENKIFLRMNALKLRHMALAMIAGWGVLATLSLILTLIFHESILLKGYHFRFFLLDGNYLIPSLSHGLIVLLIAEIFRIGTELKEESELTI
ncbi:MAG: DUF2975 domain-containing protein [Lentimicrobiaceae bacterium]|jgi:hypothetical protein